MVPRSPRSTPTPANGLVFNPTDPSVDLWSSNATKQLPNNGMTRAMRIDINGSDTGVPATAPRVADDVILTNVIGFDVKAWDPQAIVIQRTDNNTTPPTVSVVLPGDQGYYDAYVNYGPTVSNVTYSFASYGAYVDVGNPWVTPNPNPYNYIGGVFSGAGSMVGSYIPSGGTSYLGAHLPGVYDTWSTHYENAGTFTNDPRAGRANNGFDDGTNAYYDPVLATNVPAQGTDGVVDDAAEKLTSPPYPYPLRGIQVKIRVFEPDSRQVREVTVVQDFLPQ